MEDFLSSYNNLGISMQYEGMWKWISHFQCVKKASRFLKAHDGALQNMSDEYRSPETEITDHQNLICLVMLMHSTKLMKWFVMESPINITAQILFPEEMLIDSPFSTVNILDQGSVIISCSQITSEMFVTSGLLNICCFKPQGNKVLSLAINIFAKWMRQNFLS